MSQQRVQRRLAAILAADVAGYGRLMGMDEQGTARRMREHLAALRPIVERQGGRIVTIAGDGVLAEFPSVVGAVVRRMCHLGAIRRQPSTGGGRAAAGGAGQLLC